MLPRYSKQLTDRDRPDRTEAFLFIEEMLRLGWHSKFADSNNNGHVHHHLETSLQLIKHGLLARRFMQRHAVELIDSHSPKKTSECDLDVQFVNATDPEIEGTVRDVVGYEIVLAVAHGGWV